MLARTECAAACCACLVRVNCRVGKRTSFLHAQLDCLQLCMLLHCVAIRMPFVNAAACVSSMVSLCSQSCVCAVSAASSTLQQQQQVTAQRRHTSLHRWYRREMPHWHTLIICKSANGRRCKQHAHTLTTCVCLQKNASCLTVLIFAAAVLLHLALALYHDKEHTTDKTEFHTRNTTTTSRC
jgi:hypothetical protein